MLPTIVLISTVSLVVATLLLLLSGSLARFASRVAGLALAALVCFGLGEVAANLWNLVPSYRIGAAAAVFAMCALTVPKLPYWNPIGPVFFGSYVAAALAYLAVGIGGSNPGKSPATPQLPQAPAPSVQPTVSPTEGPPSSGPSVSPSSTLPSPSVSWSTTSAPPSLPSTTTAGP